MEELIRIIAQGLVEDKDAVKVVADAPDEEGVCVFSGKPSHRRVLFARSY